VPVQNVTSFGFGKDRSRTPAVANDKAAQTVRGICALNHSRQLGVADASQLARGANLYKYYNSPYRQERRLAYAARSNANFDNVGTRKNELLAHFASDHIAAIIVCVGKAARTRFRKLTKSSV